MICGIDTSNSDDTTNLSYLSIEDFSEFLSKLDAKIPIPYQHSKAYYGKYFILDGSEHSLDAPAPLPLTDDENSMKVMLRNLANHTIGCNLHSIV